MESMDCSQARQTLWPPEKPRLAGAEVLEARRHVQECPACESYFAQDRSLLDAYHRAGSGPSGTCVRRARDGEVEKSS